jgi:hypothetical protein
MVEQGRRCSSMEQDCESLSLTLTKGSVPMVLGLGMGEHSLHSTDKEMTG